MAIKRITPAPEATTPLEAEVPLTPRRRYVIPEGEIGSMIAPRSAGPAPEPKAQATAAKTPPKRRRHARKDARGKWQPTGDYEKGFCRPPAEHRFPKGNPGGPGRPKKQKITWDGVFTKRAIEKMRVGVDGTPQQMSRLEAFAMRLTNDALSGKSSAQKLMFAELQRLFAPAADNEQASPLASGRMDELILRQFFSGFTLGEPAEGTFDPLTDALQSPLAAGGEADPGWDEGNWDDPADDEDDDPDDDDNDDLGEVDRAASGAARDSDEQWEDEGGWDDE